MDTKPAEAMTEAPDLAQRIGTLFVLALQSPDLETREVAAVSAGELNWTARGAPNFVPVARLLKEREELRAALQQAVEFVDMLSYRIAKADYNAGELHKIDAWESVSALMYDGTMASYADTFSAALKSKD